MCIRDRYGARAAAAMLGEMLQMVRGTMGRAKRGLFEGKDIQFGNNVSFSKRRTRRHWKPNVQTKRLWSDTLEKRVEFRVTTHALRCIDKAGGLDNYLVKSKFIHPGSKADDMKVQIIDTRRAARAAGAEAGASEETPAQ
eukprot:TRINITY_DN20296_c0_g1_i1.p1 TRINITY_DN20296_c0_g1~~TRINITY_DN20296_c0_g1_i1.p1  ORF type:complete len:140 (+),score=24.40 TRINITY_DN20296_c0_g1_i1:98-517(+)